MHKDWRTDSFWKQGITALVKDAARLSVSCSTWVQWGRTSTSASVTRTGGEDPRVFPVARFVEMESWRMYLLYPFGTAVAYCCRDSALLIFTD